MYLERFTWRHNSILNFLALTFHPLRNIVLFVDLPGFSNPSIITGDSHRPDLIIKASSGSLYLLEITVGSESNLESNFKRKYAKYVHLVTELCNSFKNVEFINLSKSSLGIFSRHCSSFFKTLHDLQVGKLQKKYCIRRIMNIAIRTTYYIFCCRYKEWSNPPVMII